MGVPKVDYNLCKKFHKQVLNNQICLYWTFNSNKCGYDGNICKPKEKYLKDLKDK